MLEKLNYFLEFSIVNYLKKLKQEKENEKYFREILEEKGNKENEMCRKF